MDYKEFEAMLKVAKPELLVEAHTAEDKSQVLESDGTPVENGVPERALLIKDSQGRLLMRFSGGNDPIKDHDYLAKEATVFLLRNGINFATEVLEQERPKIIKPSNSSLVG